MDYILSALAVITPFLVLFAYRQGLKDGRSVKRDEPIQNIIELPKRSQKPTEAEKERMKLLEQIEKYDGNPPVRK